MSELASSSSSIDLNEYDCEENVGEIVHPAIFRDLEVESDNQII